MRNGLICFLFFLCILNSPISSAQVSFQKTISIQLPLVKPLPDSGYIISSPAFNDAYCGMLIKTNRYGDTTWSKTYTFPGAASGGSGEINDMIITRDSGFLMVGSGVFQGINYTSLAIKTDRNGNIQFAKYFPDSHDSRAFRCLQTLDGGYVVCGNGDGIWLNGATAIWKLDSAGNVTWNKFYQWDICNDARDVVQMNDSGFVYITPCMLVKINKVGDTIWTRQYSSLEFRTLALSADSFFYIGGLGPSGSAILKTDLNGNARWVKQYDFGGGYGAVNDIEILDNSKFACTGNCFLGIPGNEDAFLIICDSTGAVTLAKAYDQSSEDDMICIRATADHGFVMSGSEMPAVFDALFIKTDSLGNSGCHQSVPSVTVNLMSTTYSYSFLDTVSNIVSNNFPSSAIYAGFVITPQCHVISSASELPLSHELSIYPNPVNTSFQIIGEDLENGVFEIIDDIGKIVRCEFVHDCSRPIDVRSLPPGYYFLRFTRDEFVFTGRLMKLD